MGRFSWLLIGFAIGGGVIYGAFNYHLVKADSGFQLVPKSAASLSDTYIDVRNFGVSDWAAHPSLAADILAAEKTKLLGQNGNNAVQGEVKNLLNEIHR